MAPPLLGMGAPASSSVLTFMIGAPPVKGEALTTSLEVKGKPAGVGQLPKPLSGAGGLVQSEKA